MKRTPPSIRTPRLVGHFYVAMRENDPWHAKEVAVIGKRGRKYVCALAKKLWDALVSPQGSKERLGLERREFNHQELW